ARGLSLARWRLERMWRERVGVEADLVGGVRRTDLEHPFRAALAPRGDDGHRPELGLEAHRLCHLHEDVLVLAPAVASARCVGATHAPALPFVVASSHLSSVPVSNSPA